MQWTIDECPNSNGHFTIRNDDGSKNGDINSQPIATVYDETHAALVEKTPNLLLTLDKLYKKFKWDLSIMMESEWTPEEIALEKEARTLIDQFKHLLPE